MNATRTKPYLNGMGDTDLERYRKFVEWQIVRCSDKDLIYWADEQAAITTERLGRQAIQALKRLPYGLTIN
jgi:succinate dehydrogenase flavin-adding protein (antitoxin of CptAB toxin-antitoxin module)